MIKTFLYSLLLSFLPLSAAAGDGLACYQESASGIIADISTGQNIQPRLYNIMSSTGAVCCDPTDIVWRRSAHEKAEGGNGKELDRTNNLFWYDFLARPYDPTRGQFTGPDQKAEEYYPWNPFTFCLNNPMKYFDSDGNSPISIFAKFAAKQGLKQTARATVKKS